MKFDPYKITGPEVKTLTDIKVFDQKTGDFKSLAFVFRNSERTLKIVIED